MNARRMPVRTTFLICSLILICSGWLVLPAFIVSASIEAAPKRKTPTPTLPTPPTSTPVPTPLPGVPGTWKVVNSPNIGTNPNGLQGVAVVTANDVWAVGSFNGGGDALIQHWNGTQLNDQGFGLLVFESDHAGPVYESAQLTLQPLFMPGPTGTPVIQWEASP